ncbi:Fe-S cluster assembly protein SufD [Fimbriimonas ginsengisoli]|uniref:Iron-sulfur cluster assembly protein SufD n=1 Tax=Fimbriimonas ginsengisoli Gsoil 348 TaxID=661478 RepID=A0A068NMA3_FIMGI|nr:Fe-S cluster assembly protein SufD [Fimbriimonas ginsengisoli]AIE83915.1 Iron-sulfur cluster assembly protein SufD [Fimbriimonas ginsengisoli Gsoil 348]
MLQATIAMPRPSLFENYALIKDLLATFGPESLSVMRNRAFEEFQMAGIPTQKDEEFKYVSLRVLDEGGFQPAYGATVDRHTLEQTSLGKIDAFTVAFINGQYAPELSTAHALPKGVFVGSLQDAFGIYPEEVEKHLGKIATLEGRLGSSNDERFVHLNTAYLGEGAVVFVPKGTTLERPVHVLYLTQADHGPLVSHPRTLIVVEANSEAKILESYLGLDGVYFTNSVTEVWLGDDAILEHNRFQQETDDAVHISNLSVHQEGNSTYTSNVANFGGKIVRNDLNVWLNGEHTETWLNGASLGTGEQVVDNHTRIDHAKPNCNSFEVYKAILRDRSVGVFNGKIFVYEDAQKTDAKQTNKAILLSPTATFNTKPQLEIFADDVKCTHGATIGQLREDALFYLRARGVPKAQAEAMLVYAFAAEVLEKITISDAREALEKVLYAKLSESEELPAE